MTNRITWILGNWKQNLLAASAAACAKGIADGLADALANPVAGCPEVRVGFAPAYLSIAAAAPYAQASASASTGAWLLAQDVAAQESGAFTGEVGAAMLHEAGVKAAIVGHSERRAYYGDTNALVADKVANALAHDLTVVLCVGESLAVRDSGEHETAVIAQLSESLSKVDSSQIDARLVIAYEPVWAIGTGRTATGAQARDMHRALRAHLAATYGDAGRDRIHPLRW